MLGISSTETVFIEYYLKGLFCGIYSGIFLTYIQVCISRPASHKTNNIIFYSLSALYILSVGAVVLEALLTFIKLEPSARLHLYFIQGTVVASCNFVAHYILIYRCWIVWGHNIHVVIIPLILAITSFATRIAFDGLLYIFRGNIFFTQQGVVQAVTSIVISTTVNALVTGLIVFKIYKVYNEVKPTLDGRNGSKLRSIMFILIESGMVLFTIRLVEIVLYNLLVKSIFAAEAYDIISGVGQMLNGITPTIILVRVSMGLSFHDKESMIESITESLHFNTEDPNLNPETSIEHHERRDGSEDVDVQLHNGLDIQIVDR